MLGTVKHCIKFRWPVTLVKQSSCQLSSANSAAKWDIFAAVCIERPPYITPPLSEIERKTVELLEQKEYEQSMLNDHELRHKRDLERQEKKLKGEDLDDGESSAIITALDLEDSWRKSSEGFVAASKKTSADENSDIKSVKRALDRPLRLITKYKLGNDIFWDLPNVKHDKGETLRETAERAVLISIGAQSEVAILGNAPWSYYSKKYPKQIQESSNRIGAKTWIFKGIFRNQFNDDAKVDLNKNILDYQWATRDELKEHLKRKTFSAVDSMLHDEE